MLWKGNDTLWSQQGILKIDVNTAPFEGFLNTMKELLSC